MFLQCAKQCLNTRRFVCRSFVYDSQQRHCTLWNVNLRLLADSDNNGLDEDENFDYYELVSQSGSLTQNRTWRTPPDTPQPRPKRDSRMYFLCTLCNGARSDPPPPTPLPPLVIKFSVLRDPPPPQFWTEIIWS